MCFYDWNNIEPAEIAANYLRQVAVGKNVTVARVEIKEEIVMVLEGAWRFHLPDGERIVGPNQILLIPPGVEHSSEVLEDTVALDICAPARADWVTGEDQLLHDDPDQFLWAV
jgi:mannose-6-phosphate isomerase-like protein (cupin superfamily)